MGEVKINIAVIGNSGVGKTSIINRYEGDQFNKNHVKTETNLDFKQVKREFNGVKVLLYIWDTVGENFTPLSIGPAHRAHGFVVAYKLNDPATLKSVAIWDENTPADKPRLLVGTFCDIIPHSINDNAIQEALSKLPHSNMFIPKSLKSSPKMNENIDIIFDILVTELLTNYRHLFDPNHTITINDKNEKKGNCCPLL